MKQSLIFIMLILIAFGCKEKTSKENTSEVISIATIFDNYYKFKDRINPIEATKGGNYEYNDFIANYVSDDYQKDLKENYTHFLNVLNEFDNTQLSDTDLLSMKVMQWDCEVKLEGLNNNIVTMASPIYNLPSFELMPLFQIQSLHLYVAQLAAGGSVQPFNTVEDYDNWMKRIDNYLSFLDTSILMMKEGMSKNIVLPKVLTQKMIPQLDEFISLQNNFACIRHIGYGIFENRFSVLNKIVFVFLNSMPRSRIQRSTGRNLQEISTNSV